MRRTFPLLQSPLLSLRRTDMSDLAEMHFLRSDSEVNRYINRPPSTLAEARTFIHRLNQEWEEGKSINWSICHSHRSVMLGSICLWNFSKDRKTAEIGYSLHPDWQKRGIMSEALYMVLDFGFQTLDLDMVEAFTHRDNKPSLRLLKKHGFSHNPDRHDEKDPQNVIYELAKA